MTDIENLENEIHDLLNRLVIMTKDIQGTSTDPTEMWLFDVNVFAKEILDQEEEIYREYNSSDDDYYASYGTN